MGKSGRSLRSQRSFAVAAAIGEHAAERAGSRDLLPRRKEQAVTAASRTSERY
ncbi:hypothetical protein ACOJBO_03820 [Rhizobium beringeri]